MNANINYEIPDTGAVQEDLLTALSGQHVTVHTSEEPDFDYMENEDVAFVVKNPHNDEDLLIELGGEFSLFFGLWHGQYKPEEQDYDRMKQDIAALLVVLIRDTEGCQYRQDQSHGHGKGVEQETAGPFLDPLSHAPGRAGQHNAKEGGGEKNVSHRPFPPFRRMSSWMVQAVTR